MTEKTRRPPALAEDLAAISLVTAIACAFPSGALASPSRSDEGGELSARVAALVERIGRHEPMLLGNLPPDRRIAQWRN
jgi:hypothetical protein